MFSKEVLTLWYYITEEVVLNFEMRWLIMTFLNKWHQDGY